MADFKKFAIIPIATKIVDDFMPSTFTPFSRRFTDERARSLSELRALYNEVRSMHYASKYAEEGAIVAVCGPIASDLGGRLPESLRDPFAHAVLDLTRLETTIFEFPEIKWDVAQLSLKQQVDLERFLTAKRYFLTNHERVIDFLQGGLYRTFDALTADLPQTSEKSPFTIPLINVLPEPKKLLDRLFGILWCQSYIDDGVFVEVTKAMHLNLCAVSGIADSATTKKPYKLPSQTDDPLDETVEAYFKNTPLYDFLLAPVPLKFTYEERYSHMHVLGGSGAGKTTLLQNLILNDLQSDDPPSLVIVDSQGDLINKLSHLALFDPDGGKLCGSSDPYLTQGHQIPASAQHLRCEP